jgi:hypothetical protein
MPENPSADLLTEQELCAATGVDRYYLRRVRRWLFLEPIRTFPGRGSESRYPSIAVPMIQRFRELQRGTRNPDECTWGVWLDDDDFPVPIGKWADARLLRLEKSLSRIEKVDDEKLLRTIDTISSTTPSRTSARQPIYNRLRPWEVSLYQWAVAVAAGVAPAKSLYDPHSTSFAALKQAAGLGRNWDPPDPELLVESFGIPQMRAVLYDTSNSEEEQSRRDWKKISQMVAASRSIDWHAVRKTLDVQRTSSAQPPAPIDFLLSIWRDFDARVVMLAFLISVRRSPEHSFKLSEVLAVAAGALELFPKLNSAGKPRPSKAHRQTTATDRAR